MANRTGKGTFKKGVDARRNVGGRPRGQSITALVRAVLNEPCVEGSPITKRQAFAARVVDLAIAGHPVFAKMVWEYEDGKSIGRTESGAPGDFTDLEDVPTAELEQRFRAIK